MKKFLVKVVLFFVIAAVLDVIFGWGFDLLRGKARGGQTHKNEYIANDCVDDILILGSSKADHHYVPSVFEDSLGLSCYNAGEMGCGIIPAYIRYKMVSERQKPQIILYEVTPQYDYLEAESYTHYLGAMRQYANRDNVRNVYLDFSDELERLRLLSKMYCNNSKVVMNIKDILGTQDKWKGYEPLYGTIDTCKIKISGGARKNTDRVVDSLKLSYFIKLIEETNNNGIPIVFFISPTYTGAIDKTLYSVAFDLCNEYDIPIIDNSECELFVGKTEFFQDFTHLNHKGALCYTQYVIPQIKKYIKKQGNNLN